MKVLLTTTMALGVVFVLASNQSTEATSAPVYNQGQIILAHGHGGGSHGGRWGGHGGWGGGGHHWHGGHGYWGGGGGYYYGPGYYPYYDDYDYDDGVGGLQIGPLHLF